MTTATQAPVETGQTQVTPVEQTSEPTTRIDNVESNSTNVSNNNTNKDINNSNTIKDTKEPIVTKDTNTQVNQFLTDAGLQSDKVVQEMVDSGELSIDSMKALVEKHGEAVATLIVDKLKGLHEQSVKAATERDQAVFKQVEEAFKGLTDQTGEQTWEELSGWAKANVPNAERAELNAMLQGGSLQAKLAIDYLVNTFKKSDAFSQPAELLGAESVSEDYGLKPLSRNEYLRELNVLLAKGHDYNTSPEIRQLEARRQKGMSRGI
jgi:hypothetical protein